MQSSQHGEAMPAEKAPNMFPLSAGTGRSSRCGSGMACHTHCSPCMQDAFYNEQWVMVMMA
jgi:hypothetical protein